MKRLSLLLLLLILVLSVSPAGADVTLPADVTVIEAGAFLNDLSLSGELIIPEGVTEIGAQTFKGCTELTHVSFPSTLRSIGSEAFMGCSNLAGDLRQSGTLTVAADALTGSQIALQQENPVSDFTYTIADGEVTITGYAGTEPIGHLGIPETIEGYPVTAIGEDAFMYQNTITSLYLPDTVTTIGGRAFYDCSSLSGTYCFNAAMRHNTFMECPLAAVFTYAINTDQTITITQYSSGKAEGSVTVPDYIDGHLVTALGYRALGIPWNYNITEIILPRYLKSIGQECFLSANLVTITFPETLEYIGQHAFYSDKKLTEVIFRSSESPSTAPDLTIDFNAFCGCGLTNLVLPENAKNIGEDAFAYSALESITFPREVDSFGPDILYMCDKLKHVTLPQNITEIPQAMFWGCTSLESITLPPSVTYLGWRSFSDTTSLTSINLDNVTGTHNSVFRGSKLLADEAARIASQVITPGMTDFEKALALHDWVLDNTTYEFSFYGPEGTFFKGRGVCMSYAEAYGLLLDQAGIENLYIEAAVEMAHIWNLIKLDGEWYHVDCTWDDQNLDEYGQYRYFCLSDELIQQDHSWPYDNYPAATGTRYTYGQVQGK